jgi:formylglycine-generating enzyme required for sulfatase activity
MKKFQFTLVLIVVFSSATASFCQTYPGTLINISGGSFTMGNNNQPPMFNDQDPEHDVTVDDFKMGETEVPNAYYVVFLNDMASLGNLIIEEGIPGDWSSTPEEIANGHAWSIMADSTLSGLWAGEVLIKLSDIAGGGQNPLNRCWIELDTTSYTFSVVEGYEDWPASWVSWYGAMMYADYYGVDLPTEAEWEYAARAGQQLEYPTNDGNLSHSQANYGTGFGGPSGETYLTPVGELYPPNPFGLYNMAGNVSEWCLDWYDENFYQTCVDNNYYLNPINDNIPEDVEVKVLRGGNHTYPGIFAMSSHRFDTPPFVTTDHMGFRVVTRSVSIDIGVEYQSDWNLVGLPLEVEDASYNLIFPESIEGTLYSFDDGYSLETSLTQGEGYWLRFNEAGSTTITGIPMNEISISLNEGWNLVSGLSEDISIYSVLDPDSIIVSGTLYGFSGGYVETDMLVPGKGYWIRANNSGNITLTSE